MTSSRLRILFVLLLSTFRATNSFSSWHTSRQSASLPDTALHATFTRRGTLANIIALGVASSLVQVPVAVAETIGKADDCNESYCLGVWDGLFADCPHNGNAGLPGASYLLKSGAGCASSQDDTPGIFAEPWDYSEAPNNSLDWEDQMRILVPAIQLVSARRGDKVDIELKEGRYLRVLFTDKASGEPSIGEFYFTPNDTTVQYRVGSVGDRFQSSLASLRNMERCELIRKELRYLKIPVLRNRSRSLFFGESELDTFGPGSAMLGPPAEMTTGELEGRGSDNVDPKMKIDFVQKFPLATK
ncbi:expressed unknown protein [Seminavis robusta]|uniref:Uncharacterized protein n=1 Tax=Seminavis robusta TaxID=568900 RepID=A0A9N8DKB7_9STRA|nr:expressed unknown protein [Seminavis robusta]|eukprot:Sro130_g062040.1 n/a (301) ;mRNA; r:93897-94919